MVLSVVFFCLSIPKENVQTVAMQNDVGVHVRDTNLRYMDRRYATSVGEGGVDLGYLFDGSNISAHFLLPNDIKDISVTR